MVDVFLVTPGTAAAAARRTRLLKIVRNQRTRSIDLTLPETTELVSTAWVPEVIYEREGDGDRIGVHIRPDLTNLRNSRRAGSGDKEVSGTEAATALPPPGQQAEPLQTAPPRSGRDVMYEVTFQSREISVNGFRLSKPNFNSENEVVFDYLFRNPNRRIELREIESATGRTLTKRLREIVRDLGFKGELRDIFFPGIAKTAIEFVNPVSRADFIARGLTRPQLDVR